jgi:hypothetical protein
MVCSLSFGLGSFIFEEWESQIISFFHPKCMRKWKNYKCW